MTARRRVTDGHGGMFGPDSDAWRLDREAYLLLGAGPRALLMQLAHPLVAEGVAQHSRFQEDPWGRLLGTLRSYLGIVFGPPGAPEREVERLARLHARVVGPVNDARARQLTGAEAYRALDPELSLWVHATLVDSTLVAYEAWGSPMGPVDGERFYAETLPLGRAFGIPDDLLPADLRAFRAYLARMTGSDGPVHVTPTARDLAATILHPPLAPLARRPELRAVGPWAAPIGEWLEPVLEALPVAAYDWAMWPAVELLPPGVRAEYAIPSSPARRLAAAWILAVWRTGRLLMPTSLRWMPWALRADERTERGRRLDGDGRAA